MITWIKNWIANHQNMVAKCGDSCYEYMRAQLFFTRLYKVNQTWHTDICCCEWCEKCRDWDDLSDFQQAIGCREFYRRTRAGNPLYVRLATLVKQFPNKRI